MLKVFGLRILTEFELDELLSEREEKREEEVKELLYKDFYASKKIKKYKVVTKCSSAISQAHFVNADRVEHYGFGVVFFREQDKVAEFSEDVFVGYQEYSDGEIVLV